MSDTRDAGMEPLVWDIGVPEDVPREIQAMTAIHNVLFRRLLTNEERDRVLTWVAALGDTP